MTRALMDTTEQGNLLKTQPSPVIRPGYNNQMLRSLRVLSQTEGAHPASVDTLLIRMVGFTGELDQELKKLTAQQVIDMIKSKSEIMPLEWAQDLARKPISVTQLTAFLTLLSQLLQYSLNPYTPLNPFYNQLPQQQIQGQQPLQYLFQYSEQPMQYPIQPVQFPIIPFVNSLTLQGCRLVKDNRGLRPNVRPHQITPIVLLIGSDLQVWLLELGDSSQVDRRKENHTCSVLHIVVISVVQFLVPFPYILVDLREKLFLIQL
ncbi:MAG: hypothetical protein EZS28_051912, partial [Streblomastix strix]